MRIEFIKLNEKNENKELSHKWRTNYNMLKGEYINKNLVKVVKKKDMRTTKRLKMK